MHPSMAEQVACAHVRELLARPQHGRRPGSERRWPNALSRLLAALAPVRRHTQALAGKVPAAEPPA